MSLRRFLVTQTANRVERTSTMRKQSSLPLAGIALAFLAFALPTQIQAGPGGSNRPFKGQAAGAITGVAPSGALIVETTGNATHLGAFTRTEYTFLAGGAISGSLTFKAANGDLLTADFSGGFTSGTTAEGTYTFTGGSGRFRGATGTARFHAITPDLIHVTV